MARLYGGKGGAESRPGMYFVFITIPWGILQPLTESLISLTVRVSGSLLFRFPSPGYTLIVPQIPRDFEDPIKVDPNNV